jgi:DNA-binding transcriptional LysR family regulator
VEVELRHLRTFVAVAASLRSFVQAARAAGDLQYE